MTTRKHPSAITDVRLVAFLLLHNKVVGIGNLRRCNHLLHRGILHSKGYVVENRIVEKNRLLVHVSDEAAQPVDGKIANVHPVNRNGAALHIVIPRNKIHQSRFSRPRLSHERNGLALRNCDIDVLKHFLLSVVGEEHVLHFNLVVESSHLHRSRDFLNIILRLENLVHPLH